MTPSQMIGRKPKAAVPECCDVDLAPTSYDFSASSGLSPYACIKQHTCPICGQEGNTSTIHGMAVTFFYCKDRSHVFELDETTNEIDRICR